MAGDPATNDIMAGPRRTAAVLGFPIDHSLSPVLHRAAYRALGLTGWEYERIECPEGALAAVVDNSPEHRIGYSVTMPGKSEALAFADTVSERAHIVGSANTLVRRPQGWFADCTDVDGVVGALREFGDLPAHPSAVVLGVGGTARPVLAGLAASGARTVTVVARRDNAGPAVECGYALGLDVTSQLLTDRDLTEVIASADVVINTIPEPGISELTHLASGAQRIFDVLYTPWPTALGAVAASENIPLVSGDVMLLEQALGQVELFTGQPAPHAEMADALAKALGRPRQ